MTADDDLLTIEVPLGPPGAPGAPYARTVVTLTAFGTLANDQFVLANATSGSLLFTLPAPVVGTLIAVRRIDTSGNTVTVYPNGGTINNAGSYPLSSNARAWFLADGTNWWTL